jgi:hypothetical protein
MPPKLDQDTVGLVTRAWRRLIERAQGRPGPSVWNWTDHEQETGFLKNIDALSALLDPFLLSPASFPDLPLPLPELIDQATALFGSLQPFTPAGDGAAPERNAGPVGFSASPYPYVDIEGVDYVDSAASVLHLACGLLDATGITRYKLSDEKEKVIRETISLSVSFLLESRIEDKNGVRWLGIKPTADSHARYANLFFTRLAALALHRVVESNASSASLDSTQIELVHGILPMVCKWIMGQFDRTKHIFWMDATRALGQPIATLYALEVMYAVQENVEDSVWGDDCRMAMAEITQRMQTVSDAAALQMDVFHTLPLPGLNGGTAFYDDRGYVGAFLTLFALAKSVDSEIITDSFQRASEELARGVAEEWIDEPSGLWDDGRPLICYTRDALVGLVQHGIRGVRPRIILRESDIRSAIRDALTSNDVMDAVSNAVLVRARRTEELTPLFGVSLEPPSA